MVTKRTNDTGLGRIWKCVCLSLGLLIIVTLCQFDRHAKAEAPPSHPLVGSSDVQAEVERLVNHLDAPQLAVREQAEKDLIAMGPRILPLLEPKRQLSPEATLRLNRVRAALVEQTVATETMPTRVTCKVNSVSLRTVISEIAQQTGNLLTVGNDLGERPVTWDCQAKTFWEAIDDLTKTLRLRCEPAENGGLMIVQREPVESQYADSAVNCGIFRVQLREFAKIERGGSELSVVTIDIKWEPRLQPAVIWLRSISMEGGSPGDLKPAQGTFVRREIPVSPRKCFVSLSVPLELPSQTNGQEAILRGAFEPVLPVAMLDMAFDTRELRQSSRSVFLGQAEVTARLLQTTEQSCEVVLRTRYQEPFDAFASHRGWFYIWPVYLEVASQKLSPNQTELISMSEDGVELLYRFGCFEGLSGRFICRVPVAIVKPVIGFQLPLPSGA